MIFINTSSFIKLTLGFFISSFISLTISNSFSSLAQNEHHDEIVVMETSKGQIMMRIYYSLLPYTAGSFLNLVANGFYDGLTFHRVETWVIQGGDPNGNGTGAYVDPSTGQERRLRLEIHPKLNHNIPGAVAMARSNDPNSASCQFYITKQSVPRLNGKYCVFGEVIQGLNVVYQICPGDRIFSAQILQTQPNAIPSPSNSSDSPAPKTRGKTIRPAESGF